MKIARVTKKCDWAHPLAWSGPIEIGREFRVLEKHPFPAPEGRVLIDFTGAHGQQESLPLDSVEIIDLPPITETAVIVTQGFEGVVTRIKDGKRIGKRLRTALRSKKDRPRIRVLKEYTHFGREPYPKPPWATSLWVVRDGRLKHLVNDFDTSG